MGKKKRFNSESRRVVTTVIDNAATEKIKLDIDVDGSKYDESNALVLPSQKRKTKVKSDKSASTKILSRKHRKRLEKIVEKKLKKQNRASLLEELGKVQVTQNELAQLTSIASVQTKGLKRYFQEETAKERDGLGEAQAPAKMRVPSSTKGAKRMRLVRTKRPLHDKDDPNVVGWESSSSSEESEEEEEVVEVKVEDKVEEVVEAPKIEAKQPEEKPSEVTQKTPKKVNRTAKPAVYVDVFRDEAIQAARLKLPILAEEQQIMEVIGENDVVIIAGETGSGKTTQVPQFLYEAGYALNGTQIAITEPRRVAAISMSKRVAEEMGLSAREVSYLIRFEGNVTEDTKIKFMTDGVLMKELQEDFVLKKYSVVILDEAHERSVFTDVLIGLLSRLVIFRKKRGNPLKLIIMSATLRIEDFTSNRKLFRIEPPVVKVDARQFPVAVKFSKVTRENYVEESYKKVVHIHSKLGDGGILVFLTGQQEVNMLVRRLRKRFPLRPNQAVFRKQAEDGEDEILEETLKKYKKKRRKVVILPNIDLDDYNLPNDREDSDQEGSSDIDDPIISDVDSEDDDVSAVNCRSPMWVLPLYSQLPTTKQSEVFAPAPKGYERLCVVSTNVAETSLTIPGIKYVVDCGKTKMKIYDRTTGVVTYDVTWTSKASAEQRAGRAGRTGPGQCFRLYSSAVFNDSFPEFSRPEIDQKPIDDLYLQMRCMGVAKVVEFPFPTPPNLEQLKTAEARLKILGALDEAGKVTDIGKELVDYPVLPRFAKMLALSHQFDLLPYTIIVVAALSVQEVLLEKPIISAASVEDEDQQQQQQRSNWAMTRQRWAGTGNSLLLGDVMVLIKAVGASEYANYEGKFTKYCENKGLRSKAVVEIRKLRQQLSKVISENFEIDVVVDPKLRPPTDLECKLLRQIILCGMGDQVARKIPMDEVKKDRAKFKYAYQANNMEDPVYLDQSSVLKKTLPEFVVYQEIHETKKMYMRGVTAIEPEWLVTYVPSLCNLGEPLVDPEPYYKNGQVYCKMTGTFGKQGWELPIVEVEFPDTQDRYRWFARFLLEGKVFADLEKYTEHLLNTPNLMIRTWYKHLPRASALLNVLIDRRAGTKEALQAAWVKDPQYLLPEYLKWIPQNLQVEVRLAWPPKN